MPKIPKFGNTNLNGTRINLPKISNSSSIITDGLSNIANLLLKKNREDNQLQYQQALVDLDAFSNYEMNNPETGFKNLQGKNAIDKTKKYDQKYIDKINEIRTELKGNNFLNDFDLRTQAMHTAYARQLLIHESRQKSALALKTMQSSIELSISNAETLYDDPMSLDIGYKNIVSRVDQFAAEQGMPEELRKAQTEGIKQNYFSSALNGWIANTEISSGDFSSLGKEIKKSFAFKQLSEINQSKFLLNIDSQIKKQSNHYKDSLTLDLNNAWTMQTRGIEAPDIPIKRFEAVYGDEGKKAYEAYQDKQIMARDIKAMQGISTSNILNYLNENIIEDNKLNTDPLSANIKNDNFSERLRLQNVRKQAAISLLKLREKDPIAAAYQAGEIEQLDTSNMQVSLTHRIAKVERISNDYQTPLRIFSNNEAKQVAQIIENLGATEQSQLLKQWSNIANNNSLIYQAMLNDVGLDNSVFAYAGTIMNSQGKGSVVINEHWFMPDETQTAEQIATTMLKGLEALKGIGKKDAKIKGLSIPKGAQDKFNELTKGIFIDDYESRGAIYSATLAYYTGRVIANGDYYDVQEINNNLMEEAVNAIVGNKSNIYDTRMPWGMDEYEFSQKIQMKYQAIKKEKGWLSSDDYINFGYDPNDPYSFNQKSLEDRFTLIPSTYDSGLPNGKYFIKAGNGILNDINNNPIIIDIFSEEHLEKEEDINEIQ